MSAATQVRAKRVLAGLLVCGLAGAGAQARTPQAAGTGGQAGRARPATTAKAQPETAAGWRARHSQYFQRNWGLDIVGVRRVASGSMLRFDYRVLDPKRAETLTDRKVRPYLIDEASRTALAVPAMENVGELRQVAPLEVNRTYFMIFGNPGGLVKPGSRVTIVAGNLRVEGLVVD